MQSYKLFVDDNDTAIIYGDGWILEALDPANEDVSFTPFYDTVHTMGADHSNFSFTFKGTNFKALFGPGATIDGFTACTIDGVQQDVFQVQPSNAINCAANTSLADGTHQLFVEVTNDGGPISFDGIMYFSSAGHTSNLYGDTVYQADDSDIKWLASPGTNQLPPGGTLDLDFYGYSVSVYAEFIRDIFDNQPDSNMAFSIDDFLPENFTLKNGVNVFSSVASVRVLQTPSFPIGQHHFHLVYLGTNETVPFQPSQIIVQSSTSHATVQAFPTTLLAVSQPTTGAISSQTPHSDSPQELPGAHKKTSVAIGVGIAVGIAAILLVVSGIIWYRRRVRRTLVGHSTATTEVVVHPFPLINRGPDAFNKVTAQWQRGLNLDPESQAPSIAPPAYGVVEGAA